MKDNPETKKESTVVKIASDIGNAGVEAGKKLGTVVTEFFVGKQPTKEEKEEIQRKKDRVKQLKQIQEEAQFKKDMELAKKGQYVPPPPEIKKKKKSAGGMFSNLGKNNPMEGFGNSSSIDFGLGSSKSPDFGLDGFIGTKNLMDTKERRK